MNADKVKSHNVGHGAVLKFNRRLSAVIGGYRRLIVGVALPDIRVLRGIRITFQFRNPP
jgi:hypothetical protein